jgi:hypothetical protein
VFPCSIARSIDQVLRCCFTLLKALLRQTVKREVTRMTTLTTSDSLSTNLALRKIAGMGKIINCSVWKAPAS